MSQHQQFGVLAQVSPHQHGDQTKQTTQEPVQDRQRRHSTIIHDRPAREERSSARCIAFPSPTGSATDATVPTLGASGAIAAVFGAYFILYPRSQVRGLFGIIPGTLLGMVFPRRLVPLPADRGELRHVQRPRERWWSRVLRPRRRIPLRTDCHPCGFTVADGPAWPRAEAYPKMRPLSLADTPVPPPDAVERAQLTMRRPRLVGLRTRPSLRSSWIACRAVIPAT